MVVALAFLLLGRCCIPYPFSSGVLLSPSPVWAVLFLPLPLLVVLFSSPSFGWWCCFSPFPVVGDHHFSSPFVGVLLFFSPLCCLVLSSPASSLLILVWCGASPLRWLGLSSPFFVGVVLALHPSLQWWCFHLFSIFGLLVSYSSFGWCCFVVVSSSGWCCFSPPSCSVEVVFAPSSFFATLLTLVLVLSSSFLVVLLSLPLLPPLWEWCRLFCVL